MLVDAVKSPRLQSGETSGMTLVFGIPLTTILFVWAGAFVGAFAAGGAGFAFALASSAVWLHAFEPAQVTALVVACGSLLHVALVWPIRKSIQSKRLAPFVVGGMIGIPLGVMLLAHANTSLLKMALGVGLMAYGVYALTVRRVTPLVQGSAAANTAVGLVGGVLGGLGGYSGVVPTIWTQLCGWSKETARGVYQPYILFAHVMTLVLVGTVAVGTQELKLFALALPALAIGSWLGLSTYGRLDDVRFRQMLSVMLFLSGLTLLV